MNMMRVFLIFAFLGLSTLKAATEGGRVTYRNYLDELGRNGVSSSERTLVDTEDLFKGEIPPEKNCFPFVSVIIDNSGSTRMGGGAGTFTDCERARYLSVAWSDRHSESECVGVSHSVKTKHISLAEHDALKIFLSALATFNRFPFALNILAFSKGVKECVSRFFHTSGELHDFIHNFENLMPYPEFGDTQLLQALELAFGFFDGGCFFNGGCLTQRSNNQKKACLLCIISDGVTNDKEKALGYLERSSSSFLKKGNRLSVFCIGAGSISGEASIHRQREMSAFESLILSRCFDGVSAPSTTTTSKSEKCDMDYLVELVSRGRTPDGGRAYCGAYQSYSDLKQSIINFFQMLGDSYLHLYVQASAKDLDRLGVSSSDGKLAYFEAQYYQYQIMWAFLRYKANGGKDPFYYEVGDIKANVYLEGVRVIVRNDRGELRYYLYGLPSTLNMKRLGHESIFGTPEGHAT